VGVYLPTDPPDRVTATNITLRQIDRALAYKWSDAG
jgi:hypothetical protein